MVGAEAASDPRKLAFDARAGDDRMDRQIDYEQALLDPSTQFSQPEAVLKEPGLTREQFLAAAKGHLLTSATIGGLFGREYQ